MMFKLDTIQKYKGAYIDISQSALKNMNWGEMPMKDNVLVNYAEIRQPNFITAVVQAALIMGLKFVAHGAIQL